MHGDTKKKRLVGLLYHFVTKVFFSGGHLIISEIVELNNWWSTGATVSNAVHERGLSSKTLVDCYNFHGDICTQYFLDHPVNTIANLVPYMKLTAEK